MSSKVFDIVFTFWWDCNIWALFQFGRNVSVCRFGLWPKHFNFGLTLVKHWVFVSFQIMWLVGTNRLVPNLEAMIRETPSTLKRLMVSCINYIRDHRPLFPQVLASVENIIQSLPKINRSISEPILHRTNFQPLDGEPVGLGGTSTPKTPSALA